MKIRPSILLASISAIAATTTTVRAVDFFWNVAGPADWSNPANWNTGTVPGGGGGNFAYISNGGIANITTDTNPIQDPLIGRGAGSVGTVNHSAGILNASAGWAFVGDGGGTGTYNMSGTAVLNTGRLYVGKGGGSNGTFSTSSTGVNTIDRVIIGSEGGTGTAEVIGGGSFRSNNQLYIGGQRDAGTGTGTFTVNTTGTLSSGGDFSIGTRGGSGTLNVQNGTVNAASWMIIGETVNGQGGSNGVVNQTGGVVNNAVNDANGRFWMGTLENGANIASSATYNLSGGTLNVRNASIGRHYTGNFNQSGGTANFTAGADVTTLGTVAGSNGTYDISAGTANFAGDLQVGSNGTGSLLISGTGAVNTNSWTVAGRFAGSTGTIDVSSGNLTHTGDATAIIVGEVGTGILNVSGTGVVTENSTQGLRLAHNPAGNGTINVVTGGTIAAHFIQKSDAGSVGQVNFDGGTLRALSDRADYLLGLTAGQINILSGGLNFDSNGRSVTITQDLAGAGGLTKSGAGTLTITGNPAYLGGTVVNGGILSRGNGGTTGSIPGAVTVNPGGTFAINRSDNLTNTTTVSGAGSFAKNGPNTVTIGAELNGLTGSVQINSGTLANTNASDIASAALSVNSGGTLTPLGSAVGAINTAGVTIGVGSTLNFDFSPGGATFDQIVSSGGVTFGGAYTINLFQVGTANPFSDNGTYSLFDYATSVTGSPAGFTIGNPIIGKSYQLANNGGATTLDMVIADAVLVEWNQTGGGLWSTNTNWTPNITPNVATADVNFLGAIAAASTVDLDGNKTSGRLTFNNANSYSIGGAGTLTLDNGLAAGSITVTSGSHFINVPLALPNATGISTVAGAALQLGDVSGAGTLTKSGDGTLTLNGTTGSTGGLIVSGGLVQIGTGGATGALPTGSISLAAGSRISLNSTSPLTLANAISGAGSISQDAAGTVTNSAALTHTGFTDLNAGTFNNNGSLTGTSNIDVNNTTNLNAGSTTTTTGPITVGTGGTLTSAGTASFGNNLNVNDGGSASISGGTVMQTTNADNTGIWVANTGTGTLNISGGTTSNFETRVAVQNGSVGNLNISAGRLDTNHWTVIGEGGGSNGTVTQTGGTWNQNHTDFLSIGQGGTGVFSMSGNAVLNDQAVVDTSVRGTNRGNVIIGRNGGSVGTWNLTDTASARIRELRVGDAANSNGTVNIGGTSTVTSSFDLHIGNNGTGTVNVNGGTLSTTSGWTQIGMGAGSNGALNVTAGTVYNREMRIGIDGTGSMDISGGLVTANQAISLGLNPAGNGTLTVRGTGNLVVDNGGISVGAANPNAAGTGTGAFNVSESATINSNGGLRIGGVGHGSYSQTGGDVNIAGTTIFGNGGTFQGNAIVSGGTLDVTGELWVGQAAGGNGLMSISGGSVTANNWIAVGREGATGVLNLSGGSLNKIGANTEHIVIGSLAGNGTLNQTGGTLNTLGFGEVRLGENAGGQGLWDMSGGTATTDGVSVGWLNTGAGELNVSGTANLTIAGTLRISEAGQGIVAQTGGTMTVGGLLDVQGAGGNGTFAIGGGRLNADGGIDTSNGSFLFGAGVVSRSNPGAITISGPLTTADAGATLKLDADKTFNVSGNFDNTLGLTLDLTGLSLPDVAAQTSGFFDLGDILGVVTLGTDAFDIAVTSLVGFDSTFLFGGNPAAATRIDQGTAYNPASDSVYWVDNNAGNVTLQYNVVPEPSSLVLLVGGLAMLVRRRRRE